MSKPSETDLYPPIKAFLEAQGYEVKSEIGSADVVACRADEDPLVVELKLGFSLALFHQGIARQSLTDWVYVAVARGKGRAFQRSLKENTALARRLGLGLLSIRLSDGLVEVHVDPGPYQPRQSRARKGALLKEFARRKGDPNTGGQTRRGLVTAYRQDALRLAQCLAAEGPLKGSEVAKATGVARATRMMADNHYGWFHRVEKGVYALTDAGRQASQRSSTGDLT